MLNVTNIFFQVFSTAAAHSFSCPHLGHWRTRAQAVCNSTDRYVCLWDDLNDDYAEKCTGPWPEREGFKYICLYYIKTIF